MGGKVQGIRSITSRFQNKGEVKNTIGNIEAKELICKTHGHEVKGGNVGRRGCAGWRGVKEGNGTTAIA